MYSNRQVNFMLKNLNALIAECRELFDVLPSETDIYINDRLQPILQDALERAETTSTFKLRKYSIELINSDGLRADLPSSWLWYGHAYSKLKSALNDYQVFIGNAKNHLKESNYSSTEIKAFLKRFPSEGSLNDDSPIMLQFKSFIDDNYEASDRALIYRFLTERDWWFVPHKATASTSGKTLDRGDIFKSSLYLACRVIVANSDRMSTITEAFVQSPELSHYFDNLDLMADLSLSTGDKPESLKNDSDDDRVSVGKNKIYYGAPGTGKSYAIIQNTDAKFTIRTVFHPDTQYNDFIGSLRPVMVEGAINYEFRPGGFTDAIILAVNNPSKECTLVVEEINRASAAAAFGEIFQLLDRLPTRQSKYPINVSDPDWLAHLNSKTDNYFASGKLVIPSNLSILATMNSSDQAVMPLDTAFKRRWEFEYLPIDYSNAPKGTLPLPLEDDDGEVEVYNVHWVDFAKAVNRALALDHIPEDKLLGHRFLDDNELNENGESALKGKIFMYLWDDVLRHGQRGVIFADYVDNSDGEQVELTTYGQLIQTYDASRNVLRDSLASELIQMTTARDEAH